jgi:uncharacterized protein (DUF433 family)
MRHECAPVLTEDPDAPGAADMKIAGVHVWALVGYLEGVNWDLERASRDWGLSRETLETAIAYYQQHKAEIDRRLAENNAP